VATDSPRRVARPKAAQQRREAPRGEASTKREAASPDGERTRERLIHWGYLAAERVIGAVPRSVVLPLAAAAGNAAFDVSRPKVEIVCDNLSRPMGLPADHPRVRLAARRAVTMRDGVLSGKAIVSVNNQARGRKRRATH